MNMSSAIAIKKSPSIHQIIKNAISTMREEFEGKFLSDHEMAALMTKAARRHGNERAIMFWSAIEKKSRTF